MNLKLFRHHHQSQSLLDARIHLSNALEQTYRICIYAQINYSLMKWRIWKKCICVTHTKLDIGWNVIIFNTISIHNSFMHLLVHSLHELILSIVIRRKKWRIVLAFVTNRISKEYIFFVANFVSLLYFRFFFWHKRIDG